MSRQRSGRGGKPAAKAKPAKPAKPVKAARPVAAAAAARRGVYVQAPKSDIYVVLLGISLGAMALAALLLFLVFGRYDLKTTPTAALDTRPNVNAVSPLDPHLALWA